MPVRLLQEKNTYTVDYPTAIEFAEKQSNVFWLPNEIDVGKDLHDLKTNFTEAEAHAVTTTLKLFTLYEMRAGDDYWGGRIMKRFPRPDIQRMANAFSFFELNVHGPFYNKLNEVLGIATDEFYSSYVDNESLKGRMEFIDSVVSDEDDLASLGVFSMVEGAVLYSNFAFLKHFQAEGKNKLVNVCAGINFSCIDENLHSQGGAWLFRELKKELVNAGLHSDEDEVILKEKLIQATKEILEHEKEIISMMFEKGRIEGITEKQLTHFVESRLDICLEQLGYEKVYKPSYNPIAGWFYKNINGGQFHDFFVKVGSEYHRDWSEEDFNW